MDQVFLNEVENTVALYERFIKHSATRTRRMIETRGAIDALSRLMVSADLQQGFKILRDQGKLDQSFEALVLRFPNLFRDEAIQAAQWRISNANQLK